MNFQVTGKLIQLPGIPPMFDYEVYPQDVRIIVSLSPFCHPI